MFNIKRSFAPMTIHINTEEEKKTFLNILYAAHRHETNSHRFSSNPTSLERTLEQLIKELQ